MFINNKLVKLIFLSVKNCYLKYVCKKYVKYLFCFIFREIFKIMENVYSECKEQSDMKKGHMKELQEKLNFTERQLKNITDQIKMKIQQMVADVEGRVSILN